MSTDQGAGAPLQQFGRVLGRLVMLVFALLLVCKLVPVLQSPVLGWSWWWVWSPLWIPFLPVVPVVIAGMVKQARARREARKKAEEFLAAVDANVRPIRDMLRGAGVPIPPGPMSGGPK